MLSSPFSTKKWLQNCKMLFEGLQCVSPQANTGILLYPLIHCKKYSKINIWDWCPLETTKIVYLKKLSDVRAGNPNMFSASPCTPLNLNNGACGCKQIRIILKAPQMRTIGRLYNLLMFPQCLICSHWLTRWLCTGKPQVPTRLP